MLKSSLTHLEGVQEVSNKEESLERVSGRQGHNNGFLHVEVSLLPTQTDVQVQVSPESSQRQCEAGR